MRNALNILRNMNVSVMDSSEALAQAIGCSDQELLNFARQCDTSGNILQQYRNYIQSTSTATSVFNAALKSIAANIAIMFAINKIIQIGAGIWDDWNVTVEESQEKLNELTQRMAELNAEKAALDSKDTASLTGSEKERLQYLNDMIDTERELLDIEQRKLYRNKIGTSVSDYFDPDSDKNKTYNYVHDDMLYEFGTALFGSSTEDIVAEYQNTYEKINKTKEKLSQMPNKDSFYSRQLQDDLESYENDLKNGSNKLQKQSDEYKTKIADLKKNISENQKIINAKDRYGNPLMSEQELETAQSNINVYTHYLEKYSQKLELIEKSLFNYSDNFSIVKEKSNLSNRTKTVITDTLYERLTV